MSTLSGAVDCTAGMPGVSTIPRMTMPVSRCGAMAVAAEAARGHRE
jgi:hypothetical protein